MPTSSRLTAASVVVGALLVAVLAFRAATAPPGDPDIQPVQVPPAATTAPVEPLPTVTDPAPQPVAPVPQPVATPDDDDDDDDDGGGDDDDSDDD